jgi:hypothetical protein
LRAIHNAFGIIHSAETGPRPPPLEMRAPSPVASTASASSLARTSIQMIAGLSALPSPSSATTVQLVVASVIASIAAGSTPASEIVRRDASTKALHQSSGFCSARAPAENFVS